MNDVHKAVAGKLRSAASALRADAGRQVAWDVHNALVREATAIEKRAYELDPPKPAIEEPAKFGSIVRAAFDEHSVFALWSRGPKGGWFSEDGAYHGSFGALHNPEVLRIGVGEDAHAHEALLAEDVAIVWHRLADALAEEGDEPSRAFLHGCARGTRDVLRAALTKHGFASLLSGVGDTTADEAPADVDEFMTSAGFRRRRFCTLTPGCRMADGHNLGCHT